VKALFQAIRNYLQWVTTQKIIMKTVKKHYQTKKKTFSSPKLRKLKWIPIFFSEVIEQNLVLSKNDLS